jgi:MSHA pilin protein MshD
MSLATRRRSGGFTLIDVVVVIVVMGVMAATITTLAGRMAEQSARTVKTRQMLVVAQSLLEEIRQMPYTFCDATTRAANAGACGASIDNLGIEPGETRYTVANRFDGVTDYQQPFAMPGPGCAGLCDIDGNVLNPAGSPLSGCNAAVLLAQVAMNGIPAAQVLRIRVSVTCPGSDPLFVEGLRVRHAPNNF